jgi:hypothetical protein
LLTFNGSCSFVHCFTFVCVLCYHLRLLTHHVSVSFYVPRLRSFVRICIRWLIAFAFGYVLIPTFVRLVALRSTVILIFVRLRSSVTFTFHVFIAFGFRLVDSSHRLIHVHG